MMASIVLDAGVNVRDWHAVLKEVRDNFDPHYDFVMIPKVPLDTLDFTSFTMNLGSKMILDATKKQVQGSGFRVQRETELLSRIASLKSFDRRIVDVNLVHDTLLLVKVESTFDKKPEPTTLNPEPQTPNPEPTIGMQVLKKLVALPELSQLKLIAVVSDDVDIRDKENYIWGVFTRFDCERDIVFTEQKMMGISPIYKGIMGIDATWKEGYPKPLRMTHEIVKKVEERWDEYWK
jgi:4-hydroxy-3-polyprenylbenzoate decarboxylase